VSAILALDIGEKRIGVALGRPEMALALPKQVLLRQGRDKDIQALLSLAAQEQAVLWVVGLPCQADDSLSPMACKILTFASRLQKASGLPLAFVDEWETTAEAGAFLLQADVSRRRRRQVVDKMAAALIMERYFKVGGLTDDFLGAHSRREEPCLKSAPPARQSGLNSGSGS
jgi:putative Holliday junction resolvase